MKRRVFSKMLCGSVLTSPVVFSIKANASDELPMVDPESPGAKGLQYIEVAADDKVNCKSCSLYSDDGTGAKGKCSIFPANSVPAEAWCVAYQPAS